MGCSASRLDTLLTKAIEDPSFSLSSQNSSNSSSSTTTFSSLISTSSTNSSAIPKPRSLSAPLVHHPAIRKGDSHHLVSLTSSTYGSLIVVDNHPSSTVDGDDFSGQSSPDSVINTWELMEGLEEEGEEKNEFNHGLGNDIKLKSFTSCDLKDTQKIPTLRLGLNFTENVKKLSDSYVFVENPQKKVEELNSSLNSKPLWKLLSEESLLSKMDPNVAASYQKALSGRKLGYNASSVINKSVGLSPVAANCKSVECSPVVPISNLAADDENAGGLVGCEDKIVLYFTSLRGIRRTYEDCCTVRLILRGCRVMVDERDISMDSSYRKELQSALGGKAFSLPQLFIKGNHVGGAAEVKQMHEIGELERLLDGFPILNCRFMCDSCGDARFIPCLNCSGSRKIFLEEEGRKMRCPDCNENGLVRCPACCL